MNQSKNLHSLYVNSSTKHFKGADSDNARRLLLDNFTTGLKTDIQTLLCITNPKTFEDAVEVATKIEKTLVK